MKRPIFPCEGGCVCGAIRYRLLEDPIEFHICHCTDCQKITGNAFVMSMPIERHTLEILKGKTNDLSIETPEGIRKSSSLCPTCGSRLWSEPAAFPKLLTLRPGTLDDTSWLEPTGHIWTASAQPWVTIPEHVLQYEGEPDIMELVRAWKTREFH